MTWSKASLTSKPKELLAFLRSPAGLWSVAALLVLAVPILVAHAWINEMTPVGMQEDAFIGLRHLRHFVRDGRLAYNDTTSTMGATSPLFWILSGVGYWILRPLHVIQNLISYHYEYVWLCWTLALLSLVALARDALKVTMAAYAVIAIALFVHPMRYMLLGLEGSFLVLSVAALFVLVRAGVGTARVLFVAGILAWDRPEMAIIAAPVLGALTVLIKAPLKATARLVGALLAGWLVVPLLLLILTGNPLPHTVYAKAYFGNGTAALLANPFGFVFDRFATLDEHLEVVRHCAACVTALIAGYTLHHGIRFLRARTADLMWRPALGLFTLGYTAFVLTVPNLWDWYVTFWIGFCLIVVGLMVYEIQESLLARWAQARPTLLYAFVGVAFVMVVGKGPKYFSNQTVTFDILSAERSLRGRLSVDLEEKWHARSVWMEAVGWQGYFNDAHVYDEVGLVDGEVFRFADKYKCNYFMAAIEELEPEFIVKRKMEVDNNAMLISPRVCPGAKLWPDEAARTRFYELYEVAGTYDADTSQYSHLVLFRRKR